MSTKKLQIVTPIVTSVNGQTGDVTLNVVKAGVGSSAEVFNGNSSEYASGNCSHAEGCDASASGDYSHAEGVRTSASSNASHAEGTSTTASGGSSHAEGASTTASGDYSHAEGCGTTASVEFSHAEGFDTTASGACSHVEGCGTTASGDYSHVQGKYNVEDTNGEYAHIVGNGIREDTSNIICSNAHTLDWSGNAWFAGDVYVGSASGINKDYGSKKLATEESLSAYRTSSAQDTIDTAVQNRVSVVENKLNGSGSVSFASVTTSSLTTNSEFEIYGDTPHIDFHFNNSAEDYTSRIIETSSGKINIAAPNGVLINNQSIITKSNVSLSVVSGRLTNTSITAKYIPLLGMVFVRIYGKTNASFSTGSDYDLFNIESNKPAAIAALSVKCNKSCQACAKSSGVISIRPFETISSGYDVYIAGFWFV